MAKLSAIVLCFLAHGYIIAHGIESPVLALEFGPPIPLTIAGKQTGGKMSNVLSLSPDGFASGPGYVFTSVDGAKTFQTMDNASGSPYRTQRNETWTSFALYKNKSGHAWAHDFGAVSQQLIPRSVNATSVSSSSTFTYEFDGAALKRTLGPGVTFKGFPCPFCAKSLTTTVYASGHVIMPDGSHLQTMMSRMGLRCCQSIMAFTSTDGYNYDYLSNVSTCIDVPKSSEGPNEHDITLLPNGDVMSVFRTGAGDGRGGYAPYFMTKSKDGGKTWSKAVSMVDTDGHAMGCARPHLVQLGNATLLSGGRMMMGHDYSRSFSVWLSPDAGETWKRADGSYHHNAKASMTQAPLWVSNVNRSGWRFQYTSGYVGLAQVGPTSAAVMYDFCSEGAGPLAGTSGDMSDHSSGPVAEDFLDAEFVGHPPFYSYSMRIDVVAPKQEEGNHEVLVHI